jgi:hypothetical protein
VRALNADQFTAKHELTFVSSLNHVELKVSVTRERECGDWLTAEPFDVVSVRCESIRASFTTHTDEDAVVATHHIGG